MNPVSVFRKFCVYSNDLLFAARFFSSAVPSATARQAARTSSDATKLFRPLSRFVHASQASSKKKDILNDPLPIPKVRELDVKVLLLDEKNDVVGVLKKNVAMEKAKAQGLRMINTAEYPAIDAVVKRPSIHPIYKLISGPDLHQVQLEDRERRKAEKVVHQKVLQLTSSATDHDLLNKIKQAATWLEKGDEVRVLILGRAGSLPRMIDVHQMVLKELKSLYKPNIVDLKKADRTISFRLLPMNTADEVRIKERNLDHTHEKTKEEIDAENFEKENNVLHQPH